MTMEGKPIRWIPLTSHYDGGCVNRAEMQQYLLEILFPSQDPEEGILFCGSGLESYREDVENGVVVATLASGKTVSGCLLLACDGIHSKVRAVMHGGEDGGDPHHYCNAICYWGKTPAPRGSDLEIEFAKTQSPPPAKGSKK